MTETPPPSWRDVANGRFEVDPKPLPSYDEPAPEALAAAAAPASSATAVAPATKEHGGSGRVWAVALTVALLAGGAGLAAGTYLDPLGERDSDQQLRASELDSLDDDLTTREQALTQEQQDLAKAQRKLRKREKSVGQRAKALDKRQQAVVAAEQALAEAQALADSVVGDGVFEVGADLTPGTYVTSGGSDSCTWTVRSEEGGGDLLVDESVTGGDEATVNLLDGRFFETSGCGDWTLDS